MPTVKAAILPRTAAGWRKPDGTYVDPPAERPPDGDPYSYTMLGKKPNGVLITGQDLSGMSGGVHSRNHTDTCWVNSDRGRYLYALGLTAVNGYLPLKKAHQLSGVDIQVGQWEDLAYDPSGTNRRLWTSNCGSNLSTKNSFPAYRFPELTSLTDANAVVTVAAETFWVAYPGGVTRNCETMLCDPVKGQIMWLTKEAIGVAQVYAMPRTPVARTATGTQMNTLVQLTSGNFTRYGNLTGGDFTADGNFIYVRNNNTRGSKYSVQRDAGGWVTGFTWVEDFRLPELPNVNGVNVTAETLFCDADAAQPYFYVGAEGIDSQIARVRR